MASATSSGREGEAPTDDKVSAVHSHASTGNAKAPFRARTSSSVRKRGGIDKESGVFMRTLKPTKS